MDDGDYSDLTSLDTEEEEYTTKPSSSSAKKKGKKKGGAGSSGGYRIKNALKVPRATTYTAQALYEQIVNADINLEPEYQRGKSKSARAYTRLSSTHFLPPPLSKDVVWPEKKQIGLIDSVFRNFYIPPVIFAVQSHEDGSEMRTCIDGKQRLTSIHRFMSGLIPHKDPLTGEKLYFKAVEGDSKPKKGRRILPDKYRRLFANKQVVCVEYQDITPADEREIFQRVQLGMALTPAEKLQVISGPNATFIRSLQITYLKDESLLGGKSLQWDQSRAADFRCIAQAVICMQNPRVTGPSMDQISKYLETSDASGDAFKKNVTDTFSILSHLVQTKSLHGRFSHPVKISPVEFVLILVAVFWWKDKMTFGQVADGLGRMRADVRKTHVDVRMNNRVMKTMLDFVKSYQVPAGSKKEKGEKVAGVAIESMGIRRPVVDPGEGRSEESEDGSEEEDVEEEQEEADGGTPNSHADADDGPRGTKRKSTKQHKPNPPPPPPASSSKTASKTASSGTKTIKLNTNSVSSTRSGSPMPASAVSTSSSASTPLSHSIVPPPSAVHAVQGQGQGQGYLHGGSQDVAMNMAPPTSTTTTTQPRAPVDRMAALRKVKEAMKGISGSSSMSMAGSGVGSGANSPSIGGGGGGLGFGTSSLSSLPARPPSASSSASIASPAPSSTMTRHPPYSATQPPSSATSSAGGYLPSPHAASPSMSFAGGGGVGGTPTTTSGFVFGIPLTPGGTGVSLVAGNRTSGSSSPRSRSHSQSQGQGQYHPQWAGAPGAPQDVLGANAGGMGRRPQQQQQQQPGPGHGHGQGGGHHSRTSSSGGGHGHGYGYGQGQGQGRSASGSRYTGR